MTGLTYRDAGVDIDAGAALVRRIGAAAQRARRPELLGGLGGFAALATLPAGYREPVLAAGADGVGTKLKLAIEHDRHDDVGQDLVAMCANDVLAVGAEPFLFLDYYATAKLDVETAARVIAGIARGCELAGCALAGGETAEMPGFYQPGDYDLAGFCLGVAERERIVSGADIEVGDRIIALPANGPHANGFSLIRRILEAREAPPDAALIAQLLAPTRIYVRAVAAALRATSVKGMAHITGGGVVENVPRMFDAGLAADLALARFPNVAVFDWLREAGGLAPLEMLRTFNCGIGFALCVAPAHVNEALEALANAGEAPVCIGAIVPASAPPAPGRLIVGASGHRLGQ